MAAQAAVHSSAARIRQVFHHLSSGLYQYVNDDIRNQENEAADSSLVLVFH